MGRRAVESVVALFALLGFAFVPLGSKTGLEHSIALVGTPTAREAAAGLLTALHKARLLVMRALTAPERAGTPFPLPSTARDPSRGVRPVPPPLPGGSAAAQAH